MSQPKYLEDAEAAAKDLGDKKIIIIAEDQKSSRDGVVGLIKVIFNDQCRIIETHNGEEALETINKFQEKLSHNQLSQIILLTDDNMPKMDGRTLIDAIRRSKVPELKNMNIIFSSGDPEAVPEDVVIISKPINPRTLDNTLQVMFDQIDARREKQEKDDQPPVTSNLNEEIGRLLNSIEAKRTKYEEPREYDAHRGTDNKNMRFLIKWQKDQDRLACLRRLEKEGKDSSPSR